MVHLMNLTHLIRRSVMVQTLIKVYHHPPRDEKFLNEERNSHNVSVRKTMRFVLKQSSVFWDIGMNNSQPIKLVLE